MKKEEEITVGRRRGEGLSTKEKSRKRERERGRGVGLADINLGFSRGFVPWLLAC